MNTDTIINFLTTFSEQCKQNTYILMLMTFTNHIMFDIIFNKPRILTDNDRMWTLAFYIIYVLVAPLIYAFYKTYYAKQDSETQTHSL